MIVLHGNVALVVIAILLVIGIPAWIYDLTVAKPRRRRAQRERKAQMYDSGEGK